MPQVVAPIGLIAPLALPSIVHSNSSEYASQVPDAFPVESSSHAHPDCWAGMLSDRMQGLSVTASRYHMGSPIEVTATGKPVILFLMTKQPLDLSWASRGLSGSRARNVNTGVQRPTAG